MKAKFMCEVFSYNNHHDIYFRDRVPKGKSAVSSEIRDREFAFGLLENIKLDTPEVRKPARSLWNFGMFDPFSHKRARYRGQGQFSRDPENQAQPSFNV